MNTSIPSEQALDGVALCSVRKQFRYLVSDVFMFKRFDMLNVFFS